MKGENIKNKFVGQQYRQNLLFQALYFWFEYYQVVFWCNERCGA